MTGTETAAGPATTALGRAPSSSMTSPGNRRARRFNWAAVGPHRVAVLCVLAYVALAVLAYLPVGPFDARQLPIAGAHNPAGSDPFQMTWFLSWAPFALTHGLSLFHTNYIDYPTGVNLADNTTVPLLGILGWPITATLGPVATFNFLVRLSFALSATSMFFVMRRWCRSAAAPFLAGLLYAFGPYTASQALHLDLIFIPFPPLLVLLGDELARRQRAKPVLLGLLIGLVAGLQYLVSQDVLSGCLTVALAAAVGLGVKYRHEVRARLPYIVKAVVVALAVFAVLAGYPIFQIIAGPGHLHGPVIAIDSLQRTRADLLSPIFPTSNQLAAPGVLAHVGNEFVFGNLSENGSYLGIPLLLLLVAMIRRLRRDATVMTFMWLAVAAFVLSLGSNLTIGTWRSPVPMPESLYAHLPLLQSTIPARYSLYVVLFVSMIVGIGLDRLWFAPRRELAQADPARLGQAEPARVGQANTEPARVGQANPGQAGPGQPGRSRRWWRVGSPGARTALGALVVVGSLLPAVPFASRGLLWSASLPPAIGQAVKQGTTVLTYPFTTPASTQPMAWQAIGNMKFRLMGGYANIAVPGQSVGQRWPLLLSPPSVQEILGYTPNGDRFPQPPVPTPAIEAELRQYLKRYSIGAVVAWTGAGVQYSDLVDTTGTYWYLRRALGIPQITGKRFQIWLPVHGDWLPPRA